MDRAAFGPDLPRRIAVYRIRYNTRSAVRSAQPTRDGNCASASYSHNLLNPHDI